MTVSHVSVRVPGKAMLVGEFAVLEPGGAALSVSSAPILEVTATPASGLSIELPDLAISLSLKSGWEHEALAEMTTLPQALRYPLLAAGLLRAAGHERGNRVSGGAALTLHQFPDRPWSSGVSCALSTGTILALERLWQVRMTPMERLRVSMTAHGLVQGSGSGYDVATCLTGGVVMTLAAMEGAPWLPSQVQRLNRLLEEALGGTQEDSDSGPFLKSLMALGGWPEISRTRLVGLDAVWVVDSGKTSGTAAILEACRTARTTVPGFADLMGQHRNRSQQLLDCLTHEVPRPALEEAVEGTRKSLEALDRRAGLGIVCAELDEILSILDKAGVPAKVAGAGGGDLVVAFPSPGTDHNPLKEALQQRGYFLTAVPL